MVMPDQLADGRFGHTGLIVVRGELRAGRVDVVLKLDRELRSQR